MTKRKLDKSALGRSEDWYGNNAALRCPLCSKTFIVSQFLNKGRRECPSCGRSSAEMSGGGLTIQWPDQQDIPVVCTRAELVKNNRLDEFVSLVKSGGAVDETAVAQKLPKTRQIAFIERDGKMVAVAARKEARASYANRISRQSAYQLPSDTPELGYVVVAKSCRGQRLSSKVVKRILFEFGDSSVFATTSDEKMKALLAGFCFKWVGHEWNSERNGALLSLWIRNRAV
jgi:predicted GNAT family N-acyltransferase